MADSVKDYQMPADEQDLSDCIIVWGRRQIILRGGNRGVEAVVAGWFLLSYGDLKSSSLDSSPDGDCQERPAC
jgi:hypothetical protein